MQAEPIVCIKLMSMHKNPRVCTNKIPKANYQPERSFPFLVDIQAINTSREHETSWKRRCSVLTTTEEEQVNNNKKENPGKETESEKPPRETSQANAQSYYKRHLKRWHTIHKLKKYNIYGKHAQRKLSILFITHHTTHPTYTTKYLLFSNQIRNAYTHPYGVPTYCIYKCFKKCKYCIRTLTLFINNDI